MYGHRGCPFLRSRRNVTVDARAVFFFWHRIVDVRGRVVSPREDYRRRRD